jgi:ArsR family transcriptional regulator, arsenate/arsenite/antimonite-responsive transcriptional repressor
LFCLRSKWKLDAGGTSRLPASHYFYISRIMDEQNAVEALSALGQATRLRVFRLLVRAGPEGRPAGTIAEALSVPANTLSAHLTILMQAGLVTARRESRSIIYSTDLEGTRALLSFLVADCCAGEPALCGDLTALAAKACCETKPQRRSRR